MSAPPWCRDQLGGTSVTPDPDPEERREEDQQAGEMLWPASPLLFLTHHSFSRDYGIPSHVTMAGRGVFL